MGDFDGKKIYNNQPVTSEIRTPIATKITLRMRGVCGVFVIGKVYIQGESDKGEINNSTNVNSGGATAM